ncbi:MAG: acetylglutamate kinase [Bacteroidota bacterium]|nr:acetylglutamate kinase [Bacteroidota bacterium]
MKRIVIKLGGALLAADLSGFWQDLEQLTGTAEVVLVHGGGPQTTALAERLGHTPVIVEGRRVTGDQDLEILRWVIRGELNTHMVAAAHRHGIRAVGLSGADGSLIRVHKRPPWTIDGDKVDFGHVGDVDQVDPTVLLTLLQAGMMPIVCPPGVDEAGRLYNVNADTVALEVAKAVGASELILLTEAGAVLDAEGDPVRRMTPSEALAGVEAGWIAGGMKVKTDIGRWALEQGISTVWIAHPGALLDRSNATRIIPEIS